MSLALIYDPSNPKCVRITNSRYLVSEGMQIMPNLGGGELIIVLIIVLLLFGVGRVSRIGGELGSAVANFRKGLDQGAKENARAEEEKKTELPS